MADYMFTAFSSGKNCSIPINQIPKTSGKRFQEGKGKILDAGIKNG